MKESFYFSHDFNARNDPKILMLRGEFGNEGYALYFYCVETMAEDTLGYLYRGAIGGLSIGYGVAKDCLLKFIDYTIKISLFIENEVGIYSQRMMNHKNARKLLSDKGKAGANKRWNENKNGGANGGAIDTLMAIKEKKIKEIKENNKIQDKSTFSKPSLSEIEIFIFENKLTISAETFFNHYESNGWKVGRNPMKNWKSAMKNWDSREKKQGIGNKNIKINRNYKTRQEKSQEAILIASKTAIKENELSRLDSGQIKNLTAIKP